MRHFVFIFGTQEARLLCLNKGPSSALVEQVLESEGARAIPRTTENVDKIRGGFWKRMMALIPSLGLKAERTYEERKLIEYDRHTEGMSEDEKKPEKENLGRQLRSANAINYNRSNGALGVYEHRKKVKAKLVGTPPQTGEYFASVDFQTFRKKMDLNPKWFLEASAEDIENYFTTDVERKLGAKVDLVGLAEYGLVLEDGMGVPVIGVDSLDSAEATKAILQGLKEQILNWNMLPRTLRGPGVSEANSQRAMAMVKEDPSLMSVLVPKHDESKGELEAQRDVVGLLAQLEAKTFNTEGQSYSDVKQSVDNLKEASRIVGAVDPDLRPSPAPPLITAFREPAAAIVSTYARWHSSSHAYANLYASLQAAQEKHTILLKSFDSVKTLLQAMERRLVAAGKNAEASELNLIHADIPSTFNSVASAQEWKSKWGLKTAEQYAHDIEHAKKHEDDAKKGIGKLTGREAVLKIYEAYFSKGGKMPPAVGGATRRPLNGYDAHKLAAVLFGENNVTRETLEAGDREVDSVLGKQTDNTGSFIRNTGNELSRWFSEKKNGTQYDYVIGLAHALDVHTHVPEVPGIEMEVGYRPAYKENRLRPSWHKVLEIPNSEEAEKKLWTGYYSLRDSVKSGALKNTHFVRDQIKEIVHVLQKLRSQNTENALADVDMTKATDEEKAKHKEFTEQTKLQQGTFHKLLKVDLSSPGEGDEALKAHAAVYKESVEKAMGEASSHTGAKRRMIFKAAAWLPSKLWAGAKKITSASGDTLLQSKKKAGGVWEGFKKLFKKPEKHGGSDTHAAAD